MRLPVFAAAVVATSVLPLLAHAEEDGDRVAIQRKKYVMAHELRLSIGSMPVDPFQKGWSASVAYTVHFDYVSWEVFQITGALLTSTELRKELIDTFAIPPEDFAAPRFVATTGIEIAPFYGKQAIFNGTIVHQSLLFGLYGGAVFGARQNIVDTLTDARPAAGIGVGWRFFINQDLSLRLDVRNFVDFRRAIRANERFDVEDVLLATLSFSFNMGRDDG